MWLKEEKLELMNTNIVQCLFMSWDAAPSVRLEKREEHIFFGRRRNERGGEIRACSFSISFLLSKIVLEKSVY